MPDKAGPWSRVAIYSGSAIVLMVAGALVAHLLAPGGGLTQIAGNPAPQQSESAPPIGDMVLERQFHGPLKDTVVQRWRDPKDGTVCYIYLPILVAHSPPAEDGMVQYGPNGIGAISCIKP